VDLSEGVISVGNPPKTGSTYGTLVTAPAHVEFNTQNVSGTLRVDHDQAHVRTPVDVNATTVVVASPSLPPPTPMDPIEPTPVAPPPGPASRPSTGISSAPPPKPPTPTEIVTAAVKACAAETLRSGTVAITVSSVLTVNVNPDGVARLATFDPPLAPELQTCIARTVYATHWAEPGPYKIPIELHR
jgi:hypothetical protein